MFLLSGYAPRTIHLQGQLPEGKLRFKDKEFDAGMVPCGVPQTVIVQLKNDGTCESSFKVRVEARRRMHSYFIYSGYRCRDTQGRGA